MNEVEDEELEGLVDETWGDGDIILQVVVLVV